MIIALFIICILVVVAAAAWDGPEIGGMGIVGAGALAIMTFITAMSHADDVGTLRAYSSVIEAQEKRVAELRSVLADRFDITKTDAKILLNADSPVKAVVESLGEATKDLANARKKQAEARVSIEQRKVGPWWFVPAIYGEK